MSPTENGSHLERKEDIGISQGFPFISPGSRSLNDSLMVESGTPAEARLGNLSSDLELSAQIAVSSVCAQRLKTGADNLDGEPSLEGGEENEPPDGGKRGDKGKGKGQGRSSQGQSSTPRRGGRLIAF